MATSGDFGGHQRLPQMATSGDFLTATDREDKLIARDGVLCRCSGFTLASYASTRDTRFGRSASHSAPRSPDGHTGPWHGTRPEGS